MIDGCFNCVTFRITALGWLEKKEENDEQFWISTTSGWPPWKFLDTLSATVDWGSMYKLLLDATTSRMSPSDKFAIKMLIHWLEAPFCFWVILTCGIRYREPIMSICTFRACAKIRHVNDESGMPRSRIFNLDMLVLEILRGCRLSCGTDGPCKVKGCGELTLHWTPDGWKFPLKWANHGTNKALNQNLRTIRVIIFIALHL